jgi:cytochrome c oxidase subunit 2
MFGLSVVQERGSFVGLQLPKRARRVGLGAAMAVSLLLLGACSSEDQAQIKRLAMPEPVTDRGPAIYDLWHGAWLAAIIVGIIVWGLIGYASFAFRRRSEDEIPVQTRYNLPIEIFYTIAPVMMVVVFFYFTVVTQNKVLHTAANPDANVTVVGQQWSWTFNYNLKYDKDEKKYVEDGKGDVVFDAGTTADKPTLWLVKDKTVTFWLDSPDVIHSFWVPGFLFKMDDVPGRDNHFSLTPNREGTFDGRCAELCGVYHSRMLFTVKVVDQATYDEHMQQLAEEGNTGPATGAAETSKTPGLESGHSTGGE